MSNNVDATPNAAEDKQYRRLVQKIQAYKTPDGNIFADEKEAIENVRRQDLYNWCQEQTTADSVLGGTYNMSGKDIFEWIIENIEDLRKFI